MGVQIFFSSTAAYARQEVELARRCFSKSPHVRTLCTLFEDAVSYLPRFPRTVYPNEAEKIGRERGSLLENFIVDVELRIPEEEREQIRVGSSLLGRVPDEASSGMTLSLFKTLYGNSWSSSISELLPFFENRSDLSPQLFEAFHEATMDREERKQLFAGWNRECMGTLSYDYASKISELSPEKPLLYIGQISKKKGYIQKKMQRAVPAVLPDGFGGNLLEQKREQIARSIHEILDPHLKAPLESLNEVKKRVEGLADTLAWRILRSIPRVAGSVVPEKFQELVGESIQADLQELGLMPKLPDAGATLASNIWKRLVDEGFETLLDTAIDEMVPVLQGTAEEGTNQMISMMQGALPQTARDLMEALHLNEADEPLCLEIHRQVDGLITLVLYCRESDHHPNSAAGIQYPLTYRDIDPAKLGHNFFYQLLSYEKPPAESSVSYSLCDLFEGPIGSLGGTLEEPSPHTTAPSGAYASINDASLLETFIRRNLEVSPKEYQKSLFDFRLEAFLDLYSHIKADPKLLETNRQYRQQLRGAASRIAQEIIPLYEADLASLEELKNVAATIAEFRKLYSEATKKGKESEASSFSTSLPPAAQNAL